MDTDDLTLAGNKHVPEDDGASSVAVCPFVRLLVICFDGDSIITLLRDLVE
jgi:hypothetical protein